MNLIPHDFAFAVPFDNPDETEKEVRDSGQQVGQW